jgi:hypothetical protein
MGLTASTFDPLEIILLLIPLIVGGITHMVVVKLDILSYLKKPIHQSWFGLNKTWRGFFIMPLATWPGVYLAQQLEGVFDLNTPLITSYSSWVLALWLGLGYCLAELPNSFMKRRLGIKEGLTSDRYKWFFIILDQADSAFGCMLVYCYLLNLNFLVFVATVALGTGIHLLLNVLLYKLKIRRNPY